MEAESSSTTTKPCPIKTVVVLVQENRSFDHMLGWFKTLNPEINGVTGTESNPTSSSDSNSTQVFFRDQSAYPDPDPGHTIQATYEQVFGFPWTEDALKAEKYPEPKMNGFVQNAERIQQGLSEAVMNGFKPEAVPVFKELMMNFAICDRWFASIPSLTQPNRLFIHSATSHGSTGNDTKKLIEGYPQKTIFDSLDEAGYSFEIYWQTPPPTLFYRNLRKLKYSKNFHQLDLHFKKHCEKETLPNYVVIEQRFFDLSSLRANDDHPSHDTNEGQRLIKEVYEALRASPQWNEILFIIIYDEHGGFYDHVPTPVTGVPSPDDIVGPEPYYFKFDRLGVRVPAFLISPWIEPGTVAASTPPLYEVNLSLNVCRLPFCVAWTFGLYPTSEFEHSLIATTVKKIFNLDDFLTKRDAWAGTFEGILTRTTARTDCPVALIELPRLREAPASDNTKISELQEELVQLAAVLNGDHEKDIYPYKLVETMTVLKGAKYVEDAFKKFCEECDKARESGVDEAEIIFVKPLKAKSKSLVHKLFSCLICDN